MATPIPKPPDGRRRRNVVPPSRADRQLPVSSKRAEVPTPPLRLGAAGLTWWAWAWSTPQAHAWNDGFLDALIKRAQLEDVWVAGLDGETDVDVTKLVPLMLKLDQEFGLTPRSAAQLHYSFVEAEPEPEQDVAPGVTDIRDRLKGMRS